MRSRMLVFAGLAALCLVAAGVSAAVAVKGAQDVHRKGERAVAAARPSAHKLLASKQPFVAFRTLDRRHPANYGRFAVAALTAEGPGSRSSPAPPASA